MNFATENQTFRKIMANGLRYEVPRFQRDYAWNYEQWEDLWEDLTLYDSTDTHYMGYLVFQSNNNKEFSVIDGQQRLTTVSIIIISALYNLKEIIANDIDADSNQQRLEQLRSAYIGFTDNVTLVSTPKLTLNINNADYYRTYVCTLDKLPVRNVTKSERQLQKAVDFYRKRLKDEISSDDGTKLAQFVEGIVDKMLFTTITVGNDLNAYRVFETLNARGVQLSVPDLLKNYLFSLIDHGAKIGKTELTELEDRWQQIVRQLGQVDFTKFILADWNSENSTTSRSQLFKRLKAKIDSRGTAFSYINRLRSNAEVYSALHDFRDEFWKNNDLREASTYLKTLNTFNVTQPFSMLLAVFNKYDSKKFCRVLKAIESLSIRYNIIGSRQANVQERLYNSISKKVTSEEIKNISQIKSAFREIYIEDEEFKADFTIKSMKTAQTNKKARFLLANLEESNSKVHITEADYTLEHILPDNPNGDWIGYFDGQVDEYIDRLGNMALLTLDENKNAGRRPFNEKSEIYSDSRLSLTTTISDYKEWSSEAVLQRQSKLAEIALKRWKIEFT